MAKKIFLELQDSPNNLYSTCTGLYCRLLPKIQTKTCLTVKLLYNSVHRVCRNVIYLLYKAWPKMSRKYTVGRRNSSSCLLFPTKKMWFLPYNREKSIIIWRLHTWMSSKRPKKKRKSFFYWENKQKCS